MRATVMNKKRLVRFSRHRCRVAAVWLMGLGLAACQGEPESTRFDFVVLADTA